MIASVPPLFAPPVVKYARKASRHWFRVGPSLVISGIGQEMKLSRIFSATTRPSAWLAWW